MHCIILANQKRAFPPALLPMKGRAVIDYLIDDALLQKDIITISILVSNQSLNLMTKHVKNAYPNDSIAIVDTLTIGSVISQEDDVIVLQGNVFTSLKLQDFIRFYKQFKTVTNATYDKQNPQEIPFYIVPKKYSSQIDSLPKNIEAHTYNCGTGYNIVKII